MDEERIKQILADMGFARRGIDPHVIADLATFKAHLSAYKADREESIRRDEQIIIEIIQVREEINRAKGFLGGVAFVFTGIGITAGLAISYFAR